ncbi:MAG: PASTA domain-containing protein [Bacteroidales bacterium]|jgi:serine/threonine-protein kinase|nr:PASTA domain-containing protein [Bacteroidales bacterium]
MGYFHFLREKKFYINLLIILLTCGALLWLTFRLLDKYTRHDEVYTMPDFVGQDFQEVKHEYSKDFNFILIDSVYPKGQQPGSIFQQDPLPGSKIKKGRNVYAIIVAVTPEKTLMPNLKNISLREAIGRLDSNGLEVDHLDYVPYSYKNNVIEQFYQNQPIEEGTELVKGSKIVLQVGIGDNKDKVKVPNLIGKPAMEAKRILNLTGLNLGKETWEDKDSTQYMCVRRMSPGPSSGSVEAGTFIDVSYHSSRTLDFKKEMQELLHEDSLTNVPQKFIVDTIKETIETTDYEKDNEEVF